MIPILKDNQGFTLIEALSAMVILTIGLMALYSMQIGSTKGNTTANKLSLATTVAGNGYERLLNVLYTAPEMDPANPHTQTELTGLQLPSSVSSISWNVTEWTNTDTIDNDGDGVTDEADELGIKMVVLTVNYTDWLAKTLTITFYKSELF